MPITVNGEVIQGVEYNHGQREIIKFDRPADNPCTCTSCQTYSYHTISELRIIEPPTPNEGGHLAHMWFYRCVNPNCGKVFIVHARNLRDKHHLYKSDRRPLNNMLYSGTRMVSPPADDNWLNELTLKPAIEAHTGWLAPDGTYYPCYVDLVHGQHRASTYNHAGYAEAIAYQLEKLPELDINKMGGWGTQDWLVENGWARIDIKQIEPVEPWRYTQAQKNTMRKILRCKPDEYDSVERQEIANILRNLYADGSEPMFIPTPDQLEKYKDVKIPPKHKTHGTRVRWKNRKAMVEAGADVILAHWNNQCDQEMMHIWYKEQLPKYASFSMSPTYDPLKNESHKVRVEEKFWDSAIKLAEEKYMPKD